MRAGSADIVVEPMAEADAAAARDLIVASLAERWHRYDERFNPDLAMFPAAYAGSVVLVAKQDGAVVGTGILRLRDGGSAEIVRMSVSAGHRRRGIGSHILDALLREARRRGCRCVELETTASWADAVAFYCAHGFVPTRVRGGDQYFLLTLGGEPNAATV